MPASLSISPATTYKKYKLTALLLLLPLLFFGQSLTGLWTGALSNDSSTVRKDQLFEIVLTEYRGKVYGYSRSEFIVNDTLYYIVKRVKGTIEGDVCEVTDDDIVAYNFRGKLDKGIKVTSTFRRNGNDSAWYLAGTWKTNATKKYYSVTGKVDLGQEKDLSASKIFPHLEELKMADEVAFYKERNQTAPVAKIAKPQRVKTEYSFNNDPAPGLTVAAPDLQRADADPAIPGLQITDPSIRTSAKEIKTGQPAVAIAAPDLQRADATPAIPDLKKAPNELNRTETKSIHQERPAVAVSAPDLQRADVAPAIPDLQKAENNLSRTASKPIPSGGVTAKPVADQPAVTAKISNPQPDKTAVASNNKRDQPANTTSTPASPSSNKPVTGNTVKQPPTAASNSTVKTPVTSAITTNPGTASLSPVTQNNPTARPETKQVAAPVVSAPKKSIEELTREVAVIGGRKSEFSQVVDFRSDSLVLSLYDNGEIDGDTVSVIMNGETIMPRQGLKASAIRKTIYIQPGQNEDFTLVLFADNLGKYPPNTGLLVVHDGDDTYHLRFSSDFQKSSGIVFRRKQ